MAQAGFTPISLYFSSTAAAVPTSGNLVNGELALNTADMKLYAKNSAGTVTLLASNAGASGSVTSVSGTGTVNGLTLTGTVTTSGSLTLGGTLSLVSPPAIGSTTPNTGAFSSLTVNGGLLFNANGDSSSGSGEIKQLTGSGLTIYSKTGSSYDFTLLNAGGSNLIRNPTGTSTLEIPQAGAWFTTTGLGIGTNSPTTPLEVTKAGGANLIATFQNTTSATPYCVQIKDASSSAAGYPLLAITDSTGSSQYFRVDSSNGNVGIGTAPSTTKLFIVNTNATYSLTQNIFNASAGNLWIGQAPAATYFSVDNFAMAFCTGSNGGVAGTSVPTNERFRIAANGAFGLSGANYGNAGEVLTSGGSGAAPTWAAAGGGSQAFVAFGSTGGY
jgi:hypothetical protein